ncbi:gp53-like domain-containing protein [Burkholderia stabilis]|uniref:gp53-like domain-containing protein n=1 Tax=Burkholderia stabilis TaxID=95485 RepID=UPI0015902F99|nr:hypothetical protein [Burkholderia stabilis]
MDYTTSIDNVVHGGTGRRMHSDSIAIPTAWSGNDSNMLIWSLMEVLRLGGISGKAFNPDDPVSYTRFRDALTALFARLDSPAFTGSPQVPVPPQFDNTTRVAPTSFVQRALGNFQALSPYTGDKQLAASQSGSIINFWGGAPSTFTLPPCSAMPPAGAFLFNNSGTAPVTIARAGSDTILCNGGNPSIVVGPGDNLLLGAIPPNQWIATGGSAQLKYSSVMGNMRGGTRLQKAGAIPASSAGGAFTLEVTNGSFSLPSLSSVTPGAVVEVLVTVANVTLSRTGSDGILLGSSTVPSLVMNNGETAKFVAFDSFWVVMSGSASLRANYGDFNSQLAANGYQKLPSGLLVQWGIVNVPAGATFTYNFPLAYSAACYSLVGTRGAPGSNASFNFSPISGAQFQTQNYGTGTEIASWISIGR